VAGFVKSFISCLNDITNYRRELFIALIHLFVVLSKQNKEDSWTLNVTNAFYLWA